ncbi:phosphate ABC transporter ATP-binding protein PstB [Verrucomicrobium sp. 3C]|uniref:phosphate ABC transporter ATP-binding protein PstB n=1 Tax=Verrucomicrobium sp. 3C TaxID=1134055 RepID=UPI00037B521F|nr:phosphate ABC transporter ATP-binding protein PstB [Verrucomicrobium sp. 3C]
MSESTSNAKGAVPASAEGADPQKRSAAFQIEDLHVWYGNRAVLHGISLNIPVRQVTGIIGPSGCGKSTFLRVLNRMHEFTPGVDVQGRIRLFGEDIYESRVDPILLRRRVGMVFQKSNPFPTMSIQENVLIGLRLAGIRNRGLLEERLEEALRMSALWSEVKDRLHAPGTALSGGQQQRLCIARALAIRPEVLLMDEPCSALDPIATAQIESLIRDLGQRYSIVLVTHNLQEAGRTADFTAFFLEGRLIEFGSTKKMFTNPSQKQTEDYLTGRFS